MNYDKNSFLAGISVGRTLKGWSGAAKTGQYIKYGKLSLGTIRLSGYQIPLFFVQFGDLQLGSINLEGES